MRTILIIDDNPAVGTALEVLFSLREIHTLTAASPEAGLAALQCEKIDLVVQDMNFCSDTTSGAEGITLFRAIRACYPDLPIILLTAWTHLETAIDLVKAGAADYLAKPWDDNKLLAAVENLLELGEHAREVTRYKYERKKTRTELNKHYDLCGIVFASSAMERVIELACQVARADVPVLINGPSGAGKEEIAKIIQANSSVRDGPFVMVNCGALPTELIEAELFGAEPGAYTGAVKAREGRFEVADGGTLFLDEIGNLPLSGQIKLLRILETGQFERIGSSKTRHAKVRVISATNANLIALIKSGHFREDLYYRLNLIELALPSLAERPDDILLLSEHFLENTAILSVEARRVLLEYDWPGNVRELKNAISRARLLCRGGIIVPADLGLSVRLVPARVNSDVDLDRTMIETTLKRTRGVISQAAAELGLSRQALYRRLEKWGIDPGNLTSE